MEKCACMRCGWVWKPRKYSRPDRCARCTAFNWWRPARVKKEKPEGRPAGRPFVYPVHVLGVGQEITLEWPRNIFSMKNSVARYARRSGRVFECTATAAGWVVRRVK